MENFEYCTPTRVLFGKGQVEELPARLAAYGKKVLLTYGGGSIRKIGLYDKVKKLLDGFEIYELSGIEPNPKLQSVEEGAKMCKEKGVEVVLAVGGGSVLDCSKAICAAACYDGQAWDLITGKVPTKKALPLVTVLTLSATGSEYDWGAVISKPDTNDKVGYLDGHLFPALSILDPEYTYTVSARQTAAGAADIMNHVIEQYFTAPNNYLADKICESLLKTVIRYAPEAIGDPNDYEARAQLMWARSLGCNGIAGLGNRYSGWPCHAIEHALSGYYDITHGVGLAIVTPRWMRHILSEKTLERFVNYAQNVWGIEVNGKDGFAVANEAIEKTYAYFVSLGLPMTLEEAGIGEERLGEMAHHIAVNEGLENAWSPLSEQDVLEILRECL